MTKDDWRIINQNMREFKHPTQLWQINRICLNTGNTLKHELKKAEICYKLIQQGRSVVTEAKLLNGLRPDILCVDLYPPIAYEIVKSESDASLERKALAYPFRIIQVRV
jgi:hypothetical protein